VCGACGTSAYTSSAAHRFHNRLCSPPSFDFRLLGCSKHLLLSACLSAPGIPASATRRTRKVLPAAKEQWSTAWLPRLRSQFHPGNGTEASFGGREQVLTRDGAGMNRERSDTRLLRQNRERRLQISVCEAECARFCHKSLHVSISRKGQGGS